MESGTTTDINNKLFVPNKNVFYQEMVNLYNIVYSKLQNLINQMPVESSFLKQRKQDILNKQDILKQNIWLKPINIKYPNEQQRNNFGMLFKQLLMGFYRTFMVRKDTPDYSKYKDSIEKSKWSKSDQQCVEIFQLNVITVIEKNFVNTLFRKRQALLQDLDYKYKSDFSKNELYKIYKILNENRKVIRGFLDSNTYRHFGQGENSWDQVRKPGYEKDLDSIDLPYSSLLDTIKAMGIPKGETMPPSLLDYTSSIHPPIHTVQPVQPVQQLIPWPIGNLSAEQIRALRDRKKLHEVVRIQHNRRNLRIFTYLVNQFTFNPFRPTPEVNYRLIEIKLHLALHYTRRKKISSSRLLKLIDDFKAQRKTYASQRLFDAELKRVCDDEQVFRMVIIHIKRIVIHQRKLLYSLMKDVALFLLRIVIPTNKELNPEIRRNINIIFNQAKVSKWTLPYTKFVQLMQKYVCGPEIIGIVQRDVELILTKNWYIFATNNLSLRQFISTTPTTMSATPTMSASPIIKTEPRRQYTQIELSTWLHILRGDSTAQFNCSRISLAMLQALKSGQSPMGKAPTQPATFEFVTAIPTIKVKREGEKESVLHSRLDKTSEFVRYLDLDSGPKYTYDLTTDLTKVMVDMTVDRNIIMRGIHFSELTTELSSRRDTFGFICFANKINPSDLGHMISYYVNKNGVVYYMDAHNDLLRNIQRMSSVFKDFHNYMKHSSFQNKVFYKEVGRPPYSHRTRSRHHGSRGSSFNRRGSTALKPYK